MMLEKAPKKHNVLVGKDDMQVQFAEEFLSSFHDVKVACQFMESLNDDHVLGQEAPQLWRVARSGQIDLSPNVRARVGVWSLDIIEKGSAGANAMVREACRLMGVGRPPRPTVDYIASKITEDLTYDIKAAIWNAAYLLTGPVPEYKRWPRPWENYITWLPSDVDPSFRLHTLYWELIEYVFAAEGDEKGFRKTGRTFRPREFKSLSSLVLSKTSVFDSIVVLSAWKARGGDPYVCALKLAKIWKRQ
jgi:hypothetical protein